jgi:single-strand DNA-binding protein
MGRGDTTYTIVGNLTADPDLRWTPNGVAVANFTIAHTPQMFDKNRNEWVDGTALFLRGAVWREYAEHVAASLFKGMNVIAVGKLRQVDWEDKDGNKRSSFELDVDEIGPSLRWGTAQYTKDTQGRSGGPGHPAERGQQGGGQWGQQSQQGGGQQQAPQGYQQQRQGGYSQDDPWASSDPNAGGYQQQGFGSDDNPPF